MSTIYVIQKQITADDKSLKWLDSSHNYIDLDSAKKGFHAAWKRFNSSELRLVSREITETVLLKSNYMLRPNPVVAQEVDF
jgi:hypothetical protein